MTDPQDTQDQSGTWALLLKMDDGRHGDVMRKGRRLPRPVLTRGIPTKQDGWDLLAEYAKNDGMQPSEYRLVREERLGELDYPVDDSNAKEWNPEVIA